MKLRIKKMASFVLILALIVGLAACSGANDVSDAQNNVGGNAGNESGNSGQADGESGDKGERFTITMLDYRYGALPPADGKGIQLINEKFNVDWKPTYVSREDYDQKMSVTVAGGDMPDILIMENPMEPNFYKWAKQGAFLPLEEYMDDYETFKLLPEHAIRAATIDGHMYEIPGYGVSTYSITPMIRVDWLENLGLEMPTNYEELAKVAVAFTEDDPDQNGKKDTYGLSLSENVSPQYHLGAYWDLVAWYHKDKDGNYIPGIISDVRKEHLKWFKDLYEKGAVTQDFALMNWGQAYKEFYSGKAGIFIGYPGGLGPDNIKALLEISPNAKLAPIPPFEAPDGSKGFAGSAGMYRGIVLNAKLKDQPEKVKRIMEIIDFGRRFYPVEERNPNNKDFDWITGQEGSGYKMVDGVAVSELGEKGLKPEDYMPDLDAWAPNDDANRYSDQFKDTPLHYDTLKAFEDMHTNSKHYFGPDLGIFSPARQQYEIDLYFKMYAEQTKMVVGQTDIDAEWDNMLKKYMDEGGFEMISEMNKAIKDAGVEGPFWK